MKVYIRSYRIPTVLIIMGGIMTIVASSTLANELKWFLFWYGTVCLFLGIMGWLGIQISKSLKSILKPKKRGAPPPSKRR